MYCDETLMCCTNQNEQPPVCSTEQYERSLTCWDGQTNEVSNDDQSFDDKSSRSELLASWADQDNKIYSDAQCVSDESLRRERLQCVSNAVQRNGVNEPRVCEGEFLLQRQSSKNSLLNSEFVSFNAKTFTKTPYSVPVKDSPYDEMQPGFNVTYKPSDHKLNIVMPVKLMGPTNLNDGTDNALDENLPEGTMSDRVPPNFFELYKRSVERLWSQKHKLYLDAKNPMTNGFCCDWSHINPVDVYVSIKKTKSSNSYKIYYLPNSVYKDYRDGTWADHVIFSEDTVKRENNEKRREKEQNTFAHEFGHQIGLGDEYAVDYEKRKIGRANLFLPGKPDSVWRSVSNVKAFVYWNHLLHVFERTEGDRQYTLPNEMALFNHNGVDYSAEKKVFNGKNGFVLKYANGDELRKGLPGLVSPDPVEVTDEDGVHLVYYYDVLKAREKPGMRVYDLEKFFSTGAKIYHDRREFSVVKGITTDDNEPHKNFYYLVYSWGDEKDRYKDEYLDGTRSDHFGMVKNQYGENYALKNATMFNEDDLKNRWHKTDGKGFGNKDYIMNKEGNNVECYHYLPFLKGMVSAIKSEYPSAPSRHAPNREKDWKIV